MRCKIIIQKQADKKLLSMPELERDKISEKILMLARNPHDSRLDVKQLVGEDYYRLRVGDWRVIFDKNEVLKIISIEKIKSRGDAYK